MYMYIDMFILRLAPTSMLLFQVPVGELKRSATLSAASAKRRGRRRRSSTCRWDADPARLLRVYVYLFTYYMHTYTYIYLLYAHT